jgi:hypothetical protein
MPGLDPGIQGNRSSGHPHMTSGEAARAGKPAEREREVYFREYFFLAD